MQYDRSAVNESTFLESRDIAAENNLAYMANAWNSCGRGLSGGRAGARTDGPPFEVVMVFKAGPGAVSARRMMLSRIWRTRNAASMSCSRQ
jgi:hypothetical protein